MAVLPRNTSFIAITDAVTTPLLSPSPSPASSPAPTPPAYHKGKTVVVDGVTVSHRKPYPFSRASYPLIMVEIHSYSQAFQAEAWLASPETSVMVGVGDYVTCAPDVGDLHTYFNAHVLAVRVLEQEVVEFLATTYPALNLACYVYLRVPVTQARLG
ncbi:hypothetical protein A0H81_12509 [Grifola frondosa]|uniref:Uncharacterized protein n=1 Tax=Grifola frondosa TaxID=5627 RepID=A0A1C7LTN8_GRIFR|nr:hypothetical protein A0H81_12509 [Grifola frondosa]